MDQQHSENVQTGEDKQEKNLQEELEQLLKNIERKKEEEANINQKHRVRLIEISRKEREYESGLEAAAQKYQRKKEELDAVFQLLQNFGVEMTDAGYFEAPEVERREPFDSFDEAAEYLRDYLYASKEKLVYSADVLRCFYLGLQTNQLLLLVGRPGTGKTSLVRAFAKAFGFPDAVIVPVQSNWTGKEDLLGYYNPIEKTYIGTKFVDALQDACRKARKHPELLYFICLDEMNLAHVEYYFAEFLSELQVPTGENPSIELYSRQIAEDIMRELQYGGFDTSNTGTDNLQEQIRKSREERISDMNIEERKYFLSLCRAAQMLANYQRELTIPRNVKFIGTLNQDATTMDISPKVLDRSFVIRIETTSEIPQIENAEDYARPLVYKPLADYAKNTDPLSQDDGKRIMRLAKKVQGKEWHRIAYISQRALSQVILHENRDAWVQAMGLSSFLDYFIAATVLPKVRFAEEELYSGGKEQLSQLCENYPYSEDILKRMDDAEATEIDYWRE